MRKSFVFILILIFFVGCGMKNEQLNNETSKHDKVSEHNNDDNVDVDELNNDVDDVGVDVVDQDIDTTTSDGYDRLTFMHAINQMVDEEIGIDEFVEIIEDPDYLNYIQYTIEETDVGNVSSALTGGTEATEDVEKFFEEQRDGDSFIRIDLDDRPIRFLSIPTKNVPMTSVLNFSTHVIHATSGDTIVADEQEENYWYTYMVSFRTEDTADADVSDYRSWNELSNLEQSYLTVFGKSTELLYQLIGLNTLDLMDTEAAELILEQLQFLGDEMTMFPEPQTELDYVIYNNILELKMDWTSIASHQPNDENYSEYIRDVFQKSQDLGYQLNHILLNENKDFLGAELYIEAYQDM